MSPAGTFWFFTVLTVIGGIWAWFTIPETSGRSLEAMDALFRLPWYRIGRHGQKDAETADQYARERALEEKAAMTGATTQVEVVKDSEGAREKV